MVPHGLNRTTDDGLQNRCFTTKLVGRVYYITAAYLEAEEGVAPSALGV